MSPVDRADRPSPAPRRRPPSGLWWLRLLVVAATAAVAVVFAVEGFVVIGVLLGLLVVLRLTLLVGVARRRRRWQDRVRGRVPPF